MERQPLDYARPAAPQGEMPRWWFVAMFVVTAVGLVLLAAASLLVLGDLSRSR